jgi:hypothetical protein
MEVAPLDYGPVVLRRPFGSRLTADTLPSGCPCGQNPTVGASPWLYPSFPTSCPFRVRHGRVPQPTRRYPRLWIRRPSSERPRDLNPPDQNAAQHTLWDAPNPRRPSRSASLPSRTDTIVSPVVCSLRSWASHRGPGSCRFRSPDPEWRWRRRGLPSSWGTLMVIVRDLRPRQDQARSAGPSVTTPDAAPAYVPNEGSWRLAFSGLNHTTFDLAVCP